MYYNDNLINRISQDILSIRRKLDTLPDGQLFCQRNGKYTKFYCTGPTGEKVICSSTSEQVKQLIQKQYYQYRMDDLVLEQKYLSRYITHHKKSEENFQKFISRPNVQNILMSALHGSDMNNFFQPYKTDITLHPDSLRFKSISGNILRSKSELIIDQFLFQNNLMYKYEYPLIINDVTFHPDFTILRDSDKQLIIWEHFGMMDNHSYAQTATKKLNVYIENGYIPNINLITTYETIEHPLDTRQLELAMQIICS